MSRTIFIQPIFAPDEKRLQRNIDSLVSMSKYIKANDLKLPCIFGGWCADKSYWKRIKEVINKENFPDLLTLKGFDKNYGKAVVVKTLYKETSELDFDYFLTADSDIIFQEDVKNIITRLENLAKKSEEERKKPVGSISLQQDGQCCHYKTIYENTIEYKSVIDDSIVEKIAWPNSAGGIAGGCLFISKKAWDAVGGYRTMGVYAGDDAYFHHDLYVKGYSLQVADSIAIVHPHDDDEEYQKWKVMVCQRDSGAAKNNIDKQIEEANDFWSKRQ